MLKPLANSPVAASPACNAATISFIPPAIKEAASTDLTKLVPNSFAKCFVASKLETLPSPASTISLVFCKASPKPNLVSRAPKPAFFKPELKPSVKVPRLPMVFSTICSF